MQDKIAACALSHYESVLPLKGKPKDTEWTVYAAIVAVEKQQQGEERFWVVSCATGTKCASFVPCGTAARRRALLGSQLCHRDQMCELCSLWHSSKEKSASG